MRRGIIAATIAAALVALAAIGVHAAAVQGPAHPGVHAAAVQSPAHPAAAVQSPDGPTVQLGLGFGTDAFKVAGSDVAAQATITADAAAQVAYAVEPTDGPLSHAKSLKATLLDWGGTPVWYLQWDGLCLQQFSHVMAADGNPPPSQDLGPCPDGTEMQALVEAGGPDAGKLMTLGG